MRFLLPAVLCGATFSFALGITLPLIRVDRFLILSDEPSLVAMVASLPRSPIGQEASIPTPQAEANVAPSRHLVAKGDKIIQKRDDCRRRHGYEPRS